MALQITGYTPVALPPAQTVLTPTPRTDATEKLAQIAAQSTPAAVYHPSDETPATGEVIEAVTTWVGRTHQSADYAVVSKRLDNAYQWVKSTFETFKSSLEINEPGLAAKQWGFTVDQDGNLKVLNTAGELNSSDVKRLTQILNGSDALKNASNAFMLATTEIVKADAVWGGGYMGRYKVTTDNFQDAVDVAAMFKKGNPDGFLFNQLYQKGQLATEADEAAIYAERAAAAAAAKA